MRTYEALFILKPDSTEEQVDGLNAQLESVIKESGGKLDKTEKWGVRRLAYHVRKCSEGQYVLLQFEAAPSAVKELERRLKVSDLVLKYLTTRIDEKLKRQERRRKAREKRAARRPQAAAPAAPAPAAPGPPPAEASPTPGQPAEK